MRRWSPWSILTGTVTPTTLRNRRRVILHDNDAFLHRIGIAVKSNNADRFLDKRQYWQEVC